MKKLLVLIGLFQICAIFASAQTRFGTDGTWHSYDGSSGPAGASTGWNSDPGFSSSEWDNASILGSTCNNPVVIPITNNIGTCSSPVIDPDPNDFIADAIFSSSSSAHHFFRKVFILPSNVNPGCLNLRLFVNADDHCNLYINGTLITSISITTASGCNSANAYLLSPSETNLALSHLNFGTQNVIAAEVWNEITGCESFMLSFNLIQSTPLQCVSTSCSNATDLNMVQIESRLGHLQSGDFGNMYTTNAAGVTNIWSAIGTADLGGAPNNVSLYGLNIGNNGDKAFFGTRNHGPDRTDAVIAWGDNNSANPNSDGSVDKLLFEFHGPASCGSSTPTEVARMLPNGYVGIGTTTPTAILHTYGSLRFQGLSVGSDNLVLTSDNLGNIHLADFQIGGQACKAKGSELSGNREVPLNDYYINFTDSYSNPLGNDYPNSQGRIGIGIPCDQVPAAKLDIYRPEVGDEGGPIGLNVHNGDYSNGDGFFPWTVGIVSLSDNSANSVNIGITTDASYATDDNVGTWSSAVGGNKTGKNIGGLFLTEGLGSISYGLCAQAQGSSSNFGIYATYSGTPNTTNCAGYFDGDVYYVANLYTTSDEKLKTNIQEFKNAGEYLKKLQPKTFDFITEKYKDIMNLPSENQIGIMAQNMQSVFPNLVKEKLAPARIDTKTGKKIGQDVRFLAVNYVGLIPVLVKAANEMDSTQIDIQNQVIQLRKENEELRSMINDICSNGCNGLKSSSSDLGDQSANKLLQNIPNPFSNQSAIGYVFNTGTMAYININGLDGKLIKHIECISKGSGKVIVNSGDFAAGTYTYSLFIDGSIIDTKMMVITANN